MKLIQQETTESNRADEAWTGSQQLLYPSKSSAILYHSRVKMSSIVLPRIMELTISNILDISQLSSFKIAGNGPWTTIVLRFDECMTDASMSPMHRSTPQSCYRRKPPIQMRRDRERMEQHRNLSAEKLVRENNTSRQYNKDENLNQICKDNSALHSSISLFETAIPARREKAQDNLQQEKRPASSILSGTDIEEDEQDRDELQLLGFDLHKETTKIEETRVKTHNQSTVLPNCQVFQDAASVCHRSYSTPNTPEQRNLEGQDAESSLQKSRLETRLGASEPINNTGPECYDDTCESQESADNSEYEHSDETDESTNSETKETTQAPQDRMLERKPKDTQRSNRVPCGKIQIRIINMKHDTRQLTSLPERNNSFRKIILDTYDCKRVMVAETEDLIIKYCMTAEKITNLCAKVEEEESLYGRMRKRHLRDWPNDTLRIKDDGHLKSISEFKKKQPLGLKNYTASL